MTFWKKFNQIPSEQFKVLNFRSTKPWNAENENWEDVKLW